MVRISKKKIIIKSDSFDYPIQFSRTWKSIKPQLGTVRSGRLLCVWAIKRDSFNHSSHGSGFSSLSVITLFCFSHVWQNIIKMPTFWRVVGWAAAVWFNATGSRKILMSPTIYNSNYGFMVNTSCCNNKIILRDVWKSNEHWFANFMKFVTSRAERRWDLKLDVFVVFATLVAAL